MPNNATVSFNVGKLPQAFNPGGSWQTVLNEFFKVVTAFLPGSYSVFNYGNATPSTDDQDKPWIRTNVDGSPDRTYVFFNGKWVSRHPIEASSNERRMWVGSEAALRSYDGGDGTADIPTTTTGAMWEIDTAFAARFPVGVGAFAASGDVAVTGTATSTAVVGVDKHPLTTAEVAEHQHFISSLEDVDMDGSIAANLGVTDYMAVRSSDASNQGYALQGKSVAATVGLTSKTGSGTAHQNLPPFYGVYVIRRSVRVFLTI